MKVEVGEIYTLKNDINEYSEEFLRAGTEVIIKYSRGGYILVEENTKKSNPIYTYVHRDNLEKIVVNPKVKKPKQPKIIKSPTISQSDLSFLQEATKQLHLNPEWYTYKNDESSYIALRMENSINIFRIEPVANFEGVLSQ